MRSIVTDRVAWSVSLSITPSVSQSVCLSVTVVSPAKTAEPIDMPFELWTRAGPRSHALDGVPIPHAKGKF